MTVAPGVRLGLSIVVCAVAAAATLWAVQTPAPAQPQQPVFRAGATYVNVDAYPRGKDGKIVEGLTAADFQVFEDGKPQPVENFEFLRVSPVTIDEERHDPTSIGDSLRQAADPHNRVFVVYLDIYHTSVSGSHNIRQPVIDFLTRTIGPTDLFGVMTPEIPVSGLTFVRRVDTLEQELAKFWAWGQDRSDTDTRIMPRSPREQFIADCVRDQDIATILIKRLRTDVFFTSLEELVVRLGGLRDERKSVLLLTGIWELPRDNSALNNLQRNALPGVGMGPGGTLGIGGTQAMQGGADQSRCNSEISRLALMDFDQRFRDFLGRARRANVAFYPVDTEGLRTGMTAAGMTAPGVLMKQTGDLMTLAENTDGKAIVNTNDIGGRLRVIADDVSAYYLLGYYSTNTAQDGKFRQIEVKVKTPGVKVSARPGYLAPTAAMVKAADAAAAASTAAPSAVEEEVGRLAKLRADSALFGYGTASLAGLDVVTEIASREFDGVHWKNGGDVKLTITSAAGTASAAGKIEPGARSTTMHVPAETAGAGPWKILAQVTSPDGRLDETFDVAAPALKGISPVQYFRGTPSPRSPLRPVADMQFRRTERLHLEWALNQPLDERTARVLSRKGDALPLPVALTERPDGDRTILAADVQLAPLSEGDYIVELVAGRGGENIRVLVAFRLVR